MHNPQVWNLLSNHLSANESLEEKELFNIWFNESKNNQQYFNKVKMLWHSKEGQEEIFKNKRIRFRDKFTLPRIKSFILDQALGNLIGFMTGMWVVSTFTHKVLEKRSLKNLFGLAGRKHIVVNEIPLWLQNAVSIVIGFIALELINHFFQTKQYLVFWKYLKKLWSKLILRVEIKSVFVQ